MKLKAKLSTLLVSLALLGGCLVGCGNKGGSTPTVKNFVNYSTSENYVVEGINEEGYASGEKVNFTVTIAESKQEDLEIDWVKKDGVALTPSGSAYSFTMGNNDVTITIKTKEILKYALSYTGSPKKGVPLTFNLTFGEDPVTAFSLTTTEPGKAVVVGKTITYTEVGTYTVGAIDTSAGAEVVASIDITITEPEEGETEFNPITAARAVEIAKTLQKSTSSEKHPSERYYYIEDAITSVTEAYSEQYKNFTGYMGSFYLFRIKAEADCDTSKLVLGAKVMVKAKLLNYNNSVMETEDGTAIKADTSAAYLIVIGDGAEAKAVQVGTDLELEATVYPVGATATIDWSIGDSSIASFEDEGNNVTVTGESVGTTVLTASSGSIVATMKIIVQAEPVKGQTEDDPLTPEEAVEIGQGLQSSSKDNKYPSELSYFIEGAVTDIQESYTTQYKNMTVKMGSFLAYRIKAIDATTTDLSGVELGTTLMVKTKLMKFGSDIENYETNIVVKFNNDEVTMLKISETTLALQVGTSGQLTANAFPLSLGAEIEWSSSNEDLATVDSTGKVTAGNTATEDVVITAACGDFEAQCALSITEDKPVDKWNTDEFPECITLGEIVYPASGTSTEEFTAIGKVSEAITPKGATKPSYGWLLDKDGLNKTEMFGIYNWNGTIAWDDMDEEDQIGLDDVVIVKGKVENYNGTKEIKNVKVLQVNGIPVEPDELEGIILDKESADVSVDGTLQLTATADPVSASLEGIVWSSSDDTKATVDQTGLVKGIAVTTTPVTITASIGEIYATCSINVKEAGSVVTITKTVSQLQSQYGWTISAGSTIGSLATDFNLDANIKISTTGQANCGSVWGSGDSMNYRIYQNKGGNLIVTALNSYSIVSITLKFTVSSNGTLLDGSTTITSGSEITVGAASKTLTVGASSGETGQVRITSFSVTYSK